MSGLSCAAQNTSKRFKLTEEEWSEYSTDFKYTHIETKHVAKDAEKRVQLVVYHVQ